jgi:hypothetical protein
MILRLSENAHLPFDKLMVLSKVEGLRSPHPLGFVRASLGLPTLRAGPRFRSEACGMDIFDQPHRSRFFDSLLAIF